MKKQKTKPCPIEGCWQQIPETKHMCEACTSWWYRIAMKSPEELVQYLKRMARFTGRANKIRAHRGKIIAHHRKAA